MPNAHGPFLYFLSLNYTLHGQLCQNGFWFRETASSSPNPDPGVQSIDLVNTFLNTTFPVIRDFQNNQVHYKSIVAVTINPKNGPIAELPLEQNEGTQIDESLPSYCAAILSLRTGLGGRSNRGRLYIAGISESDSTDSQLTVDSLSRLQSIGTSLLTSFGGTEFTNNFRYVVWSRIRAGVVADGPAPQVGFASTPITQVIARRVLGTQKHRQIGHGG